MLVVLEVPIELERMMVHFLADGTNEAFGAVGRGGFHGAQRGVGGCELLSVGRGEAVMGHRRESRGRDCGIMLASPLQRNNDRR